MHYVAIVDGKDRHVEITELSPERYQLVLDGRRIEVDAHMVSNSTVSMLIDGQAYNIEVEKTDNVCNLLVRGHVVSMEVLDLRRMRLRRAADAVVAPDGPVTITAPMPGKIVAVLVPEGQPVTEGQGVVVVEAMKMENELRAPRSGVVRDMRATVGAAVEGGAVLCRIEGE